MKNVFKFFRFGNRAGHNRKSGGHVFAQLQWIRCQSEFVQYKWQNRDIECLGISRQRLIRLLSEEVNIAETLQHLQVGGDLADKDEVPLGPGRGEIANQVQIHQIRNQAEESDQGVRAIG